MTDPSAASWAPVDRPGAAPPGQSQPGPFQPGPSRSGPSQPGPPRPGPAMRGPAPPGYPPPGYPAHPPPPPQAATFARPPSGLFPAGPQRPSYREPFPVRAGQVAIGAVVGTLWMALFGLLATSARAYAWWTIVAAALAWPVLVVLLRFGDRGAAVGAAASTGFGLAVAGVFVAVRWVGGDWLLW